ncbi:uncharacterized protein LOC129787194 isoform X2 [Lutzomyia longipalpis]|uniref:uncharacterized protein LOC129787194 isoform X2 n=1 Tax=Lutzomyia longipalpis TaxID=7200 RepID=UPI0024841EDB|nr:uncharacterized protein LOC129787194 isoform X2 [Lutzomyia longipalpis]
MERILALIISIIFLQLILQNLVPTEASNDDRDHTCFHCIGDMNSECAFFQMGNSQNTPTRRCPPDSFRHCYTSLINGTVYRGCRSDNFCYNHTCKLCYNPYKTCNYGAVATLECIQCTSDQRFDRYHPKCLDKAEEIRPTPCFVTSHFLKIEKGCYTRRINETIDGKESFYIYRGCFTEFVTFSECPMGDLSCMPCAADGCNIHHLHDIYLGSSGKISPNALMLFLSFLLNAKNYGKSSIKKFATAIIFLKLLQISYALFCIKCDSSQHESCHYLQSRNAAEKCVGRLPEGVEDRCFIQYSEVGLVTIRGCLSENPHLVEVCKDEGENCSTCNINQTLRGNCAICDTETDLRCTKSPSLFVQMCPFVHEYEAGGCYFHMRSDGGIQRGCMVAGASDFINNCRTGEKCEICRGQSCNTEVDFEGSNERLWCHQCEGNFTSDCAYYQPGTKSTECTEKLKVGEWEQCYVVIDSYNRKVIRGCTGDEFCKKYDCLVCNYRHCNYHNMVKDEQVECIQCSSNLDDENYKEKCENDLFRIDPRRCRFDEYYTNHDSGCYSIRLRGKSC